MALKNSRRKRNKEELLASVLLGAKNGTSKTHIMYFSFLSFDQLQKYLAIALDAKLLSHNNNKYSITERGFEFLNHFQGLREMEKKIAEQRRMIGKLLEHVRAEQVE